MGRKGYEGTGMLPGMEDEMNSALRPPTGPPTRPRIRSGPAPRPEFPTRRVVMIVLAVCAVLIGSIVVIHRLEQFLIRDPRFALNGVEASTDTSTLEISGAAHASRGKIEAVFNDDSGRSVYLLPMNDRRSSLRAVDWVKDASIVRIWPNRVVVRVSERTPVAFVTLAPSRFALIDEEGVILPPATDRFPVPVLVGVRPSDPPSVRRDRVRRMLRLTRELGELTAKISQIDVSDADNLTVTQPHDGRVVTLLLGDRNYGLRYQNFLRNYSEIKRRLPGAATLDLRLEDRITVVE
jgi:cell division protein FtsQ